MQSIGVLKERRPEAAYDHLLPQGEKGKEKAGFVLFSTASTISPAVHAKPASAAHMPFAVSFVVSLGISNTRQVVVACASRRPLASVMRASAVAARRPTLRMRPSDRTGPVCSVMPLMKEILNSSVV